jgi:hypothetical protein
MLCSPFAFCIFYFFAAATAFSAFALAAASAVGIATEKDRVLMAGCRAKKHR